MQSARPQVRSSAATDIALIAVFAALIAVLGLPGPISIAGSPAPIVLQNMGIMLAGAVLGWRRGFLSVGLFLLLVLIGLPLFPGLPGGPGAFSTPRIGFQISYLFVALLIGLLTQMMLPKYRVWLGVLINIAVGIVVCYAFGIVGFMAAGGLSFGKSLVAMGPYIPGDLAKCVLAAVLAAAAHRAAPGLTPPLRETSYAEERDPFATDTKSLV